MFELLASNRFAILYAQDRARPEGVNCRDESKSNWSQHRISDPHVSHASNETPKCYKAQKGTPEHSKPLYIPT